MRTVQLLTLKVVISSVAAVAVVLHLFLPALRIDAVSLGLLALAVLPWLAPLVKSAELPGGFKIEFQDVKEAAERVAAGAPDALPPPSSVNPSYLLIAEHDPNLALVGLRIEIERRLRALAERTGIPKNRPLTQLTANLQEQQVLSAESSGGLLQLISLGNQAAHGVPIAPNAATSAVEFGPRVLQVLDSKLLKVG